MGTKQQSAHLLELLPFTNALDKSNDIQDLWVMYKTMFPSAECDQISFASALLTAEYLGLVIAPKGESSLKASFKKSIFGLNII